MAMHEDSQEYDVILAGGGTAACIIAGRLALADPSLSILIVEGGRNNLDDPTVTNPAMYLSHLAPNSQTALFYKAKPSEDLAGREVIVPSGGILGGGSSINFMMYTRGQLHDYDSWKTEGWDFKSLLPFFKKFETYHSEDSSIDMGVHGQDGPIHVTRYYDGACDADNDWLEAGKAVGGPLFPDLCDFKSCGGFARWYRYVSHEGKRQDTAHRFVHPLMASKKYPNLHLLVSTKVVRVLFDSSNRAKGIECEPTASFQPTISLSKPQHSFIKARKLVIVSSGALGTPSVLERSGVGGKALLEKLKIPLISDLPGVGEDYQDHNFMFYPYKTNLGPKETLDEFLSGGLDFAKALEEKNPILGWNAINVASKLRPSDAEIAALGPDFQKLWNQDFAPEPERPLMLMAPIQTYLGDHSILPPSPTNHNQYVTMGTFTAYPYSRGSIHITSPSVTDPPNFATGFLSHPADVQVLVWAYKKQREIYRRTNAYEGELSIGHPQFAKDSPAALTDGPVHDGHGFRSLEERAAVQDIAYSAADDAAIEAFVRENVQTTWHSLGTCKMAPKEEGGVVDPLLNVYGTEGLKVADLSIVPGNVAANTNNTALMVGEKAADIVVRELGLDKKGREEKEKEEEGAVVLPVGSGGGGNEFDGNGPLQANL